MPVAISRIISIRSSAPPSTGTSRTAMEAESSSRTASTLGSTRTFVSDSVGRFSRPITSSRTASRPMPSAIRQRRDLASRR